MGRNFFENLVAEWYEYNGYFIRTNIHIGKREKGGYSGEMDIVAFDPKTQTLVHIETSMDANSWKKRKDKLLKTFSTAKKQYKKIFPYKIKEIQQKAIFAWAKSARNKDYEEIKDKYDIDFLQNVMKTICDKLKEKDPFKDIVPESYPLLRAIQLAMHYGLDRVI